MNDVESARRRLMIELATRLERFRGEMTDAEFGTLLADMVRVAERFREIDAQPGAKRPVLPTPLLDWPPIDPRSVH